MLGHEQRIIVRPARETDLPTIVELWFQLMSEHEERDAKYWALEPAEIGRRHYEEYRAKLLAENDHLQLVAEVGDRVVGFVACRPLERPGIFRESRVARVDEVVVDRDFRRQGVGQALISSLLSALREQGYEMVELMVDADNPAAQSLYHSLGFYTRQHQLVKLLEKGEEEL